MSNRTTGGSLTSTSGEIPTSRTLLYVPQKTCEYISRLVQIADRDRQIATLYDMLDYQDATNVDNRGLPLTVNFYHHIYIDCGTESHLQVRTVFIIDPKKVIRLMLSYPASSGRNFDEIIRSVQTCSNSRAGVSNSFYLVSSTVRYFTSIDELPLTTEPHPLQLFSSLIDTG